MDGTTAIKIGYYEELKAKADKWDEKETPFTVTDSDGIFGMCKCNHVVSSPQIYCHNCGQKVKLDKDGESEV